MDHMRLDFSAEDLDELGELVESMGIDIEAIEEKIAAVDRGRLETEIEPGDDEWDIDMDIFLELDDGIAQKAG